MKRIAALLGCVLLMCLSATGCRKNPAAPLSSAGLPSGTQTTVPAAPADTLSLVFNREDTLDPYAAKTQFNMYLSTLLYQPLMHLDDGFMPTPMLAQTAEMTDATHLTVTLRKNAVFSDGSAVTPEDVVYAFKRAKETENYRAMVSNLSAASVRQGAVVFTLSSPDPYASSCLLFPIIKRMTGTADKAAAPVGSGPYVYDPENERLTLNPKADTKGARFTAITLTHMISSAEARQSLDSGSIHYLFDDLSTGSIPRTAAKDQAVNQNQLVYLGVNSATPLLSSPDVRRAISLALDRTAIASSAYTGRALPAISPFHPLWRPAADLAVLSANQDTDAAAALLKAAASGEPTGKPSNGKTRGTTAATTAAATVAATAGTAAGTTTAGTAAAGVTAASRAVVTVPADAADTVLVLLYPSGNSYREAAARLIVRQLALAGLKVTATPVSYSAYLSRLSAGEYDLYLGEIRLTPNMNLQIFFSKGGAAAYGVPSGNAAAQYAAFRDGRATLSDFVEAFADDMPYIPLCWRQGMAAYHRSLSVVTPSAYDVFDGILQWQ